MSLRETQCRQWTINWWWVRDLYSPYFCFPDFHGNYHFTSLFFSIFILFFFMLIATSIIHHFQLYNWLIPKPTFAIWFHLDSNHQPYAASLSFIFHFNQTHCPFLRSNPSAALHHLGASSGRRELRSEYECHFRAYLDVVFHMNQTDFYLEQLHCQPSSSLPPRNSTSNCEVIVEMGIVWWLTSVFLSSVISLIN